MLVVYVHVLKFATTQEQQAWRMGEDCISATDPYSSEFHGYLDVDLGEAFDLGFLLRMLLSSP